MAMLRAMVTFLLENGKIETTVTRAKEVRAMTEKMITIGEEPTISTPSVRCSPYVTKEDVAKKLVRRDRPEVQSRPTAAIPGSSRSDLAAVTPQRLAIIELV